MAVERRRRIRLVARAVGQLYPLRFLDVLDVIAAAVVAAVAAVAVWRQAGVRWDVREQHTNWLVINTGQRPARDVRVRVHSGRRPGRHTDVAAADRVRPGEAVSVHIDDRQLADGLGHGDHLAVGIRPAGQLGASAAVAPGQDLARRPRT